MRCPAKTEVSSQWIRTLIENDDRTGAAAISIVLLAISFVVLFILRAVGSRAAKHGKSRLAARNPTARSCKQHNERDHQQHNRNGGRTSPVIGS